MTDSLKHEFIDNQTIINTLDVLKNDCENCFKCELGKTRTKSVFSDGNPLAKLVIIGEAPGKNEDETGTPFVGRAGQLLDKLLASAQIDRKKDTYICNTVKCRPPENRVPKKEEKAACRVYLEAQLNLIRPKIILLTGSTAVSALIQTKKTISHIRGEWFEGPNNSKLMPIFHPSYLLRYSSLEEGSPKWLMLQDLKKVKKELENL